MLVHKLHVIAPCGYCFLSHVLLTQLIHDSLSTIKNVRVQEIGKIQKKWKNCEFAVCHLTHM